MNDMGLCILHSSPRGTVAAAFWVDVRPLGVAVVQLGWPRLTDKSQGDHEVIIGTFSAFVILVTISP
jgi:hypothetical protein